MHYWDTSTLAKLYVAESDSAQFQSHLAATGSAATSVLARWEIFRVLARKEAEKVIIPGAAEVIFAKFEADIAASRVVLECGGSTPLGMRATVPKSKAVSSRRTPKPAREVATIVTRALVGIVQLARRQNVVRHPAGKLCILPPAESAGSAQPKLPQALQTLLVGTAPSPQSDTAGSGDWNTALGEPELMARQARRLPKWIEALPA